LNRSSLQRLDFDLLMLAQVLRYLGFHPCSEQAGLSVQRQLVGLANETLEHRAASQGRKRHSAVKGSAQPSGADPSTLSARRGGVKLRSTSHNQMYAADVADIIDVDDTVHSDRDVSISRSRVASASRSRREAYAATGSMTPKSDRRAKRAAAGSSEMSTPIAQAKRDSNETVREVASQSTTRGVQSTDGTKSGTVFSALDAGPVDTSTGERKTARRRGAKARARRGDGGDDSPGIRDKDAESFWLVDAVHTEVWQQRAAGHATVQANILDWAAYVKDVAGNVTTMAIRAVIHPTNLTRVAIWLFLPHQPRVTPAPRTKKKAMITSCSPTPWCWRARHWKCTVTTVFAPTRVCAGYIQWWWHCSWHSEYVRSN